ncbi:MAG: tRNA lysidine(34) synthetase TilS [Deltaproteobacteria bacterium]|nr:tRNA lysidine(34) synthetase TilS [Deltaproteobacteria bacterium]MBN2845668.1 tRNA lysidine(34) synthetase TilS [Deltaproteobacteria bacterium]
MLKRVRETIEKHGMLSYGDRVGVAVSGGPDSVALLNALIMIAPEYGIQLSVLHLNHGIRGEASDNDEAFVREEAKSKGIPFRSKSVSVPDIRKREKGSLEDISRKERYRFFEEIFQEDSLDKIALGHNLDDQAETVIIKFLRGSGMEGLRGMLPVRDGIYIRPLINVARSEIASFLEKEGIGFVRDASNESGQFLRNRIRNEMIPELRDNYNNALVDTINRTATILRIEDDFIQKTVEGILADWGISRDENEVRIEIKKLTTLHEALRQRIIKELLEDKTSSKKGIGYRHVRAVMDLAEGENVSGVLSLPFHVTVGREYDTISICRNEDVRHSSGAKSRRNVFEGETTEGFSCQVKIPCRITVPDAEMSFCFEFVEGNEIDFSLGNAVFIDYNKIVPPMYIRNVREGDRIQPFGMEGTKKLSDIFIDKKIPKGKRGHIPLVADEKSVLWIPQIALSQRVKITDMTEKVVKAEII